MLVEGLSMGHYYDKMGTPQYYVEGKNGKLRDTTVRDARKHGWLPSVTEILKLLASPGLDNWKVEQALKGNDPRELAQEAADKGTVIHDAMEQYILHGTKGDLHENVIKFLDDFKGEAEKVIVGDKSAGKMDFHGYYKGALTICDFKTQDTKEGKANFYDKYLYQLCGYKLATGDVSSLLSVVISRNEPGVIQTKLWKPEDVERGTKIYTLLEDLFYAIKKL